jgi:hypothetical protein
MGSDSPPTLLLASGLARFLFRPQPRPQLAWVGPRFVRLQKVRRTDTILRNGLDRSVTPSWISLHFDLGEGTAELQRTVDRILPN